MWFITAIAVNRIGDKITTINRPTRTFGFFDHYSEALSAVEQNQGSLHECLYDYIVIECIEEGIHPMVLKEEWFWWVKENNRWEDGIEKPEEFKGTVNWALG